MSAGLQKRSRWFGDFRTGRAERVPMFHVQRWIDAKTDAHPRVHFVRKERVNALLEAGWAVYMPLGR